MDDNIYIKRLRERLRQKPDSRLFLSLAEELRKRGKMDEAKAILSDGIKQNPFAAARLTLRRWYLLDDIPSEAEKESLGVIEKSLQDAHACEMLAEGYEGAGRLSGIGNGDAKERALTRLERFSEAVRVRFAQYPTS